MHKIKIDACQLSAYNYIAKNIDYSKVFFIPVQCEATLNSYLNNNPDDDTIVFRRHHYEVISAMLQNKSVSAICSTYKKHVDIQVKVNFVCNDFYLMKEQCYLYFLKKQCTEYYLILDYQIDQSEEVYPLIDTSILYDNHWHQRTIAEVKLDISEAIIKTIIYYTNEYTFDIALKKITYALARISSFNDKKVFRNGSNVNRVYSTFTALPAVVRTCLHVNKVPFYQFDMKASQPTLLVLLLKEYNLPIDDNYIDDVHDIYESLMALAKELEVKEELVYRNKASHIYKLDNRKHMKKLLYGSVFFGQKTEKESITAFLFKSLYPQTYESILKITEITECTLATLLQNLESKIMFKHLPECYFYTVHDALYVTDRQQGLDFIKRITEEYKDTIEIRWDETLEVKISPNIELLPVKIISRTNNKCMKHIKHKKHDASEKSLIRAEQFKQLINAGMRRNEILEKLGISVPYYYTLCKKLQN
jgi:hypothetical protein